MAAGTLIGVTGVRGTMWAPCAVCCSAMMCFRRHQRMNGPLPSEVFSPCVD